MEWIFLLVGQILHCYFFFHLREIAIGRHFDPCVRRTAEYWVKPDCTFLAAGSQATSGLCLLFCLLVYRTVIRICVSGMFVMVRVTDRIYRHFSKCSGPHMVSKRASLFCSAGQRIQLPWCHWQSWPLRAISASNCPTPLICSVY